MIRSLKLFAVLSIVLATNTGALAEIFDGEGQPNQTKTYAQSQVYSLEEYRSQLLTDLRITWQVAPEDLEADEAIYFYSNANTGIVCSFDKIEDNPLDPENKVIVQLTGEYCTQNRYPGSDSFAQAHNDSLVEDRESVDPSAEFTLVAVLNKDGLHLEGTEEGVGFHGLTKDFRESPQFVSALLVVSRYPLGLGAAVADRWKKVVEVAAKVASNIDPRRIWRGWKSFRNVDDLLTEGEILEGMGKAVKRGDFDPPLRPGRPDVRSVWADRD